jgi:hypothetical protein
MKNILILYPDLFNCFSKFERKISNITRSMGDFNICYLNDPNKLVDAYVKTNKNSHLNEQIDCIEKSNITHAILFDDGELFNEEIELLKVFKVPLRIIKVEITRVINIKKEPEYKGVKSTVNYEYIGRGSYWGNPHSMFEEGDDRDEVIRKYKYDFDFEKFPHINKEEVFKLVGKRLGCFCKPATCHGDVLADFLNQFDDGK